MGYWFPRTKTQSRKVLTIARLWQIGNDATSPGLSRTDRCAAVAKGDPSGLFHRAWRSCNRHSALGLGAAALKVALKAPHPLLC